MGLVRAHSERVAQRRRTRPCRVLLVDETSIRRRHRYVTVVACGDSGKVLAMIPGRTKTSLARFFRDQGAWWCRQVEIAVSDGSRSYQAAIAQYLPDARHGARPVPRREMVHPRTHPRKTRDTTPRPPPASPNVRTRPVPSPLHPLAPSRPPNRSPPGAPRPPLRRSSTSPHRLGRAPRALPAVSGRRPRSSQPGPRPGSPISTPPVRSPNTAKSWTRSSPGEKRSWPTTATGGYPTDPSKGSTTSSRSYAASPTASPTMTITQPAEILVT